MASANRSGPCGCSNIDVSLFIRGIKGVQHHDRDGCAGKALEYAYTNGAASVIALRVAGPTQSSSTFAVEDADGRTVAVLSAKTPGTWANDIRARTEAAEEPCRIEDETPTEDFDELHYASIRPSPENRIRITRGATRRTEMLNIVYRRVVRDEEVRIDNATGEVTFEASQVPTGAQTIVDAAGEPVAGFGVKGWQWIIANGTMSPAISPQLGHVARPEFKIIVVYGAGAPRTDLRYAVLNASGGLYVSPLGLARADGTARHGWFHYVSSEAHSIAAWHREEAGNLAVFINRYTIRGVAQHTRLEASGDRRPDDIPLTGLAGDSTNVVIAPRPVAVNSSRREYGIAWQYRANDAQPREIRFSRLDRDVPLPSGNLPRARRRRGGIGAASAVPLLPVAGNRAAPGYPCLDGPAAHGRQDSE